MVEVAVMSSNTIVVLFQVLLMSLEMVLLSAVSPTSARAESAQLPTVTGAQAAAGTELPTNVGGATSTLLKSPSNAPAVPGATAASALGSQTDNTDSLSPAQRRAYQRAASAFTAFCSHWESLLHEREANNLEHLSWQQNGGLEIATYTGYGKLETCECHASKEGLPIGKIRYEEMLYSIAGKTINEARRAEPKLMHEISTLEIFSWDKGRWFY
jgi:hypothetical protein